MTQSARHIPVAIRRAVIERDGLTCRRCGVEVIPGGRGPQALHLDHVEHWAAGGHHTVENLLVCCARCNLTRTKPKMVVRDRRGTVMERWNGTWWWVNGYTPPSPLDDELTPRRRRELHSFDWVLEHLQLSPIELLRIIEDGTFRATEHGPIHVQLSEELEAKRREDELRRRKEARERAHRAYVAARWPTRKTRNAQA